jgi:hypothetical protein
MKKILLFFLLFIIGCSNKPSKEDEALSQVNITANEIAIVGEDGWYERAAPTMLTNDPWGKKLRTSYKRHNGYETLRVYSNGPDGLPYTKDDICSTELTINNVQELEEISKKRKKSVKDYSGSITEGATQGIIKGLKGEGKEKKE